MSQKRKPNNNGGARKVREWLVQNYITAPNEAAMKLTGEAVARMFGVTRMTVVNARCALGLARRNLRKKDEKLGIDDKPRTALCREWMIENIINGPQTRDNAALAMTDAQIAKKFGVTSASVVYSRSVLNIPCFSERLAKLPREIVKPGGEPRAWLPPGANACSHLRGLVRRPGYKEPAHCLCGLVLDAGEIERSRCHEGCPYYEKNKLIERTYARRSL